jgi:polar amino acid transport system substrate-binding protein
MHRSTRTLTAVLAALVLSACGGSDADEASDEGSGGAGSSQASYGDCEVSGERGSFELEPATEDVLTVQTSLPSPAWWRGDSPETVDGGFEYCMAANIAHRAGLSSVKVDNVSFDALVAGQTDDFDLALAQITITDERKKAADFSEPYFSSDVGVLVKKDSGVTAENISDKVLGAAAGTTALALIEEEIQPTKPAKTFSDTDAMVQAVASGQIDAAIQDTAIMLGFAKGSGGVLEVVGQYKTGEEYGAIYPKGSAQAATINEIIEQMKSDGTTDALGEAWLAEAFGEDPAKVPSFSAS